MEKKLFTSCYNHEFMVFGATVIDVKDNYEVVGAKTLICSVKLKTLKEWELTRENGTYIKYRVLNQRKLLDSVIKEVE